MKARVSCYFYKHDFSVIPWFYKQWPDSYGQWQIVFNWLGFELVAEGKV